MKSWGLTLGSLTLAMLAAQGCSSEPQTSAGAGGAHSSSSFASASSSSQAHPVVAVSSSTGLPLTPTFEVSGTVTDGTNPVEGAIVMQGGGPIPTTRTGPDGKYTLEMTQMIPGTPTVVAAKVGYRAGGVEFDSLPEGPVDLTLQLVTPPDNVAYQYGDPGTGDPAHDNNTSYCGHCHTTFAKQFQSSAHAEAARSPFVQDLYAGVTEAYGDSVSCTKAGGVWRAGLVPGAPASTTMKCYLGFGVLPDLNTCGGAGELACDDPAQAMKPAAFGACADCHAPGIDGRAGGRNLHDAVGVAFQDGDHCDLCHHVCDVDLTKPAGVAGSVILQRPYDKISDQPGAKLIQATFGPLPDVPNAFVGGSYQPKYATSEICGGCHLQRQEALVPGTSIDKARWPEGLPTHSTYSEWLASSANAPNAKTCQDCHMPPDDTGLTNAVDVTTPDQASITFGFARTPNQIRKHVFRGPLDGKSPRFIDGALSMNVSLSKTATDINVGVSVANTQGAHAIPTGEPLRSLVLVVQGAACGAGLVPSGGMTIGDLGGEIVAGTVGGDVTANGAAMTWASGAGQAKPGDVVRVVRPTGVYDDYPGVEFFANPMLTPAQKGMEIRTPVGAATVAAVNGNVMSLSGALGVEAGDLVYLGDPLPSSLTDGEEMLAVAGLPGATFARVLVDGNGSRNAPHYRAVDMVSDNRLAAGATSRTSHAFTIPRGCSLATITATLLYRRLPFELSRARGWKAQDYVVAGANASISLP